MGVIWVGPRETFTCQDRARDAIPPPATRWHGPRDSGTSASNWFDAYRLP